MNRRDRRAAGRKSQTVSDVAGAVVPDALYKDGLGHLTAGRYLDAQICCEQALAAESSHADALHLMGLLSFQARQYDHAVEWISRAIRENPKPEYLANLGHTLRRLGRNEEALKVFDKAAQLDPDDAELWASLGKTLVDLARPAEALLSFQHTLKLKPRHRAALYASAVLLCELKRPEEALGHFDRCIELQPDDASTLRKRALVFIDLERFEQALADFQRAHALDPDNADICNDVGHVLTRLRRLEEALQWFDKAIARRPQFGIALSNKATSLRQLNRLEEASGLYRAVISLEPENAWAELALAHVNLTIGNFEAGWIGHEARLRVAYRSAYYPKFSQPMWRGEGPIEGKTFLIYAEEGLGDSIQFARYIPMLAARGARVILVVQEAARALLSEVAGVVACLPKSVSEFPPFDFHCALSSLPLAFGTRLDTIPAGSMYLPVPSESRVQAWEDRLGPRNQLRVGLVWSGNPSHKNDFNRSILLRTLTRILDTDATFVSLQKDPRPDDKAVLLERTDIVDLTGHLTDFTETAALVSCLDLVVTVDTSVAHLAAALGRPTWILLPYVPDWRWLLDRDDNPWYPTVRLFRQTETREYESVLDRVRAELRTLIAMR
jgi:tetratricopeptide (TPR) repeat protein